MEQKGAFQMKLFECIDGLLVGTKYLAWAIVLACIIFCKLVTGSWKCSRICSIIFPGNRSDLAAFAKEIGER